MYDNLQSSDLTKINYSMYLIVKSLYHIIEMCKIKLHFDILFLFEKVAIFLSPKPGSNKIFNFAHLYYMYDNLQTNQTNLLTYMYNYYDYLHLFKKNL